MFLARTMGSILSRIESMFSQETILVSGVCAFSAFWLTGVNLISYIVLMCTVMALASLVSTSMKCHDPKNGKPLNNWVERKGQARFAAIIGVVIIIIGMVLPFIPYIGLPFKFFSGVFSVTFL